VGTFDHSARFFTRERWRCKCHVLGQFEQDAAIEFLNNTIHANQDKAMLVSFSETAELVADLIPDTEKLATAIRQLRPGGGTSLYDAVFFACRDKLSQDQPKHKFRRAIVLVTDGDDNQSHYTRDQALEMAQKAEVIIYTISTNTSGQKLKGDKVLEHFADETGGRAFFPFKIQDVSDAFSQIQDELRSQYAISYKPADLQPNGKYHTIQILADNKKYKVRSRKGYYAPLR